MPAPPEGRCHFPVKKGNKIVWCGEETNLVDPNTGSFLMWCAKHYKELEDTKRKIQGGHKDYPRGSFVAGKVVMHQ